MKKIISIFLIIILVMSFSIQIPAKTNQVFSDYGLDYFTKIGSPLDFTSNYGDLSGSWSGSGHESINLANGYMYVNITSSGGSNVFTYFDSITSSNSLNISLYNTFQIKIKGNESGLRFGIYSETSGIYVFGGNIFSLTTSFQIFNFTYDSRVTTPLNDLQLYLWKRITDVNFQGNESYVIDYIKLMGQNITLNSQFSTFYSDRGFFSFTNSSSFPYSISKVKYIVNNDLVYSYNYFNNDVELTGLPKGTNNMTVYIYDSNNNLVGISNNIYFQNYYVTPTITKPHYSSDWFYKNLYLNAFWLMAFSLVLLPLAFFFLGLIMFRRELKRRIKK